VKVFGLFFKQKVQKHTFSF